MTRIQTSDELLAVIQRNVHIRCEKLETSFATLCAKHDVSPQIMWRKMAGNPTLASIEQLARILGITPNALLKPVKGKKC